MNYLVINSNEPENSGAFVGVCINNKLEVEYTSKYLDLNDKNDQKTSKYAFPKSHDKLVQCLLTISNKIEQSGSELSDIDVVSMIVGPGSFTGIRVGMALAKGVADYLNKKIIPIDNFELQIEQIKNKLNSEKFSVFVASKSPEFYYALYENGIQIKKGCVDIDSFIEKFDKNTSLIGNFSNDYIKKLGYFETLKPIDSKTELDAMVELIKTKYQAGLLSESKDIEPIYLKDFAFKKSG